MFQLASVSKQFTAAAILILYEDNKLDLDDKVITYFPNFPYQEVSIRQLLNHTSGLPKYFWLAEHKWDEDHAPSNGEMMDLISKHDVQRFFSPGANFDYSNIKSMSFEAREKLKNIQPTSISQASRISGVSPNDISVLLVYMGR